MFRINHFFSTPDEFCLFPSPDPRPHPPAGHGATFLPRHLIVTCAILAFSLSSGFARPDEGHRPVADEPTSATKQVEDTTSGDSTLWPEYSFRNGGFQLYQSEDGESRLSLGGEMLGRYAHWHWYEGPSGGEEYDYAFKRTRLNLKYSSPRLTLFLQPQFVYMYGVPEDAFAAPPEGPLGMGGLYYKHTHDDEPDDVGLHQAYIAVKDALLADLMVQLGRFEYSDGLEAMTRSDGKHFNALKKIRLGDRMISPFGWSAFGRSFDGALLKYDKTDYNITAGLFYPTQGGWEEDINERINDIQIIPLTLTAKRGSLVPGTEFALFYYNYRDERDVTQRVDNSGIMQSHGGADLDIHMLGGHAVGTYNVGPGVFDVLLWGGVQTGDWYDMDHNAFAVDAEAGYQFTDVFAKPWIRAGYYIGSGDSSPGDGDHETFFQMAPGTRKYELLPYCDLMNTEDLFVQLLTFPTEKLMVRADYHVIRLNEENDRWYMGSGPTQEQGRIFGYIGRPSSGENDLSQEVDLMLKYQINPHWSVSADYCHVFGGDVISGVYGEDDEANYASVSTTYRF